MEEDEVDDPPPFWLRPSSAAIRRRGRTSSFSFSILLVILLVVAAALALVFLVLPSFPSYSTTLKTPNPKTSPQTHSIKKGWDFLNLVLVLFAVICGFLSRTGGSGTENTGSGQTASRLKSNVTPGTTYRSYYYDHGGGGYSEEKRDGGFSSPSTSFNSRIATTRNSFSYPDLRQESAWSSYDVDCLRFYDDTSNDRRGFVDSEQIYGRSGSRRWGDEVDVEEVKSVVEDAAAAGVRAKEGEQVKDVEPPQPQSESPLPSPAPPSPPPPVLPSIESRRKHRRRMSYEAIPRVWKDDDFDDNVWERPPSTPPPPPPPPSPPPVFASIESLRKHRRRMSYEAIPWVWKDDDFGDNVWERPPSTPLRRTSDINKSKRPRNPEPSSTVIQEGNRSPRIKSTEPSGLNSPDITEYEDENEKEDDQISEGSLMSTPMSLTMTTPNVKGGDGVMFCPSPDVDTEADKFIASFREGLKAREDKLMESETRDEC